MRQANPNLSSRAFTIVELIVSAGVVAIVSLIAFTLMRSSLTLYVKNFSTNDVNGKGRSVSQRLADRVQNSVQTPVLVDANGAAVAGNGPAAGVQCLIPASLGFYKTTGSTPVSASTISTTVNSTTLKAPAVGDSVYLKWYDSVNGDFGTMLAPITAVSVAGTTATLTLSKTVGASLIPMPAAGTSLPVGQPFQILNRVAFIAVPGTGTTKLRYYPSAKSVATNGAAVFNNAANFRELTDLVPMPSQTACLPFSYTVTGQRSLDMNLRSVSKRYDNRSGTSGNYFNSLREKIAFRSILVSS